jgi:hypothetical protein
MIDKHIIYMKAGPYCGYSLEEIEAIKNNEDKHYGQFYWGYGGVFCHPKRVMPFVKEALKTGKNPKVYFSVTKSKFFSPIARCREFSANNEDWKALPPKVILVGNQYSLVCTNLKRVNFTLNMSDYVSMLGEKPVKNLSDYIKYRIDKACAIYSPDPSKDMRNVTISYVSELVPPYCVYVR